MGITSSSAIPQKRRTVGRSRRGELGRDQIIKALRVVVRCLDGNKAYHWLVVICALETDRSNAVVVMNLRGIQSMEGGVLAGNNVKYR